LNTDLLIFPTSGNLNQSVDARKFVRFANVTIILLATILVSHCLKTVRLLILMEIAMNARTDMSLLMESVLLKMITALNTDIWILVRNGITLGSMGARKSASVAIKDTI
jgi:hypothetical protein